MRSSTLSSNTGGRRSRMACASAGRPWRPRGWRSKPSCRPCRSEPVGSRSCPPRKSVASPTPSAWRKVNGTSVNRCIPILPGDPMVRKKTLSELDQAEIKLQSLLEKRDALNREAQLLRQERDLVHETKRQIGATLRGLKDRRASFAGEARKHRQTRDELQAKAKALIEMKRKLRGSGHADVGVELRALKRRVTAMEMRQQTASLTLSAENDLIGELKYSIKRMKQLEVPTSHQDEYTKEI